MRFTQQQRDHATFFASTALDASWRGVLVRDVAKRRLLTQAVVQAIEEESERVGYLTRDIAPAVRSRVMANQEVCGVFGSIILIAIVTWLIHKLLDHIFSGGLDWES